MSAITVTIIKAGRTDTYGLPLVVGQSYVLDNDYARALYQSGYASVIDPVVFDDDSLSQGRVITTCLRFPGFRTALLASLASSSTASRTAGVVTVTATGHGITTGATYFGFRFYYPGSTSLAAGWYDSILTIPDANTITFSAAGTDFASESINSGSAWTTATEMFSMTISGGALRDQSKVRTLTSRESLGGATSKTISVFFGGTLISSSVQTASSKVDGAQTFRCLGTNKQIGQFGFEGTPTSNVTTTTTKDVSVDQILSIRGTISAASDFIAIYGAHVEIIQ